MFGVCQEGDGSFWSEGKDVLGVGQKERMCLVLLKRKRCVWCWSDGKNVFSVGKKEKMCLVLVRRKECVQCW